MNKIHVCLFHTVFHEDDNALLESAKVHLLVIKWYYSQEAVTEWVKTC